jgi:NAD(P)-dependent dehydrogenase (short-subunit alcohol dehydrogenase family)
MQPLFFDKTADKDCDRKKGAIRSLANTIKQLDVLVNNASVFYPTSMQNANENDWNTKFLVPVLLLRFVSSLPDPLWKCYKLHGFLMGVFIIEILAKKPKLWLMILINCALILPR